MVRFRGEVQFLFKTLRQVISVVAWSWALLVFALGYFGRGGGDYNHIVHTHEVGPPPLFTAVIIPVLKVLVVAPSAVWGMGVAEPVPGAAGYHASVQSYPGGQLGRSGDQDTWGLPQQGQERSGGQWCAGCLPQTVQKMEGRSDLMWGNERLRDSQQQPQQFQEQTLQRDGQYRFSYSGGDSGSRQEQRNLDGSVTGSYAFTDPEGQAVRVEYRAAPNQGFSAYPTYNGQGVQGPSYSSAGPAVVPSVPQETPEVLAARAQFFRAYEQQLQLVKANQQGVRDSVVSVYSENAKEGQEVKGGQEDEKVKGQLDFKTLPELIAVPDGNGVQTVGEIVDEDGDEDSKDAIVISADDEDSGSIPRPSGLAKRPLTQQVQPGRQQQGQQPQGLVQPSYSFSTVVGGQQISYQPPQMTPGGQQGFVQFGQQPQMTFQGQGGPPVFPEFAQQSQNIPQGNQQQSVLGLQNFPSQQVTPGGQQGFSQFPQTSQMTPGGGQGPLGLQNFPSQQPQQAHNSLRGGLEPYFYYVSVGGQPHYVTSNNFMRSDYPTSLKAQQVGAAPIAAQHDSQVAFNAKESGPLTRSSPPLYLDFDPAKTFEQSKGSGVPGVIYGFVPSPQPQQPGGQGQGGQQGGSVNGQRPFVGFPLFYLNN